MEDDLGGFADEVAAGESVAADVGGERRRRGDLDGEGAAGWGGGGYFGGVFCGVVAVRGDGEDESQVAAVSHGGGCGR